MIIPNKIKKGDTIGVVAPSNPIIGDNIEEIKRAKEIVEADGFKVKFSKNLFSNTNGYTGKAKEKAEDINNMFADKEIKMIWCAKGGNNSNSTFEYLDFETIKNNPKIICGYSDITSLTNIITEKTGTTAGVAYDSKSVTMKVTAVDNNSTIEIAAVSFTKAGKKLANNEAAFNNTYTANKLSISKTVAGNLGDKSKYFDFTVTLTGKEGEEYSLPATITGGSDKSGKKENVAISGTTTFKLKHGDTITIENLPAGVSYKVEEATPSDYTMNATGQEGTMDAEAKTAAFTNTKTGDIDTGVYLDNLPYILVFAGVLAIAAVFIVRRRRFED